MNCLEFRRIVGAEPGSAAPDVAEHAAQCEACARYQKDMQQMDQLIHRALSINVDAAPVARQPKPKPFVRWGLAASLLLAIAIGVFWIGYPRETLASEAVDHALHEPDSLQRTSEVVTPEELAEVLGHAQVKLKSDMGRVSYATVCPFRGHHVPHFVVQTEAGPVTVLLLRDEPAIQKSREFKEGKFQGVIMPAPYGVLAVLGENVPVEQVAQQVLAAVEYQQPGW
ncbi:MAG: DUF3379 family protein [Povalibacter sp.]